MRFVTRSECLPRFEGKSVAVVGSGPGVLGNAPGLVDSFEVVVRVNNYKVSPAAGYRTDVFYSFFGTSIRKTRDELIKAGVTLCMCKTPDADITSRLSPSERAWHERTGNLIGIDYRPHFERRRRAGFWFCDTYIPTVDQFMEPFGALSRRQPTTGFAAIFDVLSFDPQTVFLTGFDFFRSGLHNVDEPWRAKNEDDPIGHAPDRELSWLRDKMGRCPIQVDALLAKIIETDIAA